MSVVKRVALITGASSGIGKACAERLARRGFQVYGTSRRASFPSPGDSGDSLLMIPMDVDDDGSVREGVEFVRQREGRIDVLVNNAGFGIAGAVEDTSLEEARSQFETNFFGVLRVCRAVLPTMRTQGGGYIINISSIGGVIGLPFQGLYSAAKFAVEGLSEALSMEVRPFGIHVVLVEPGDMHTGFTASRRRVQAADESPVYREAMTRAMAVVEHDELHGGSPEQVARLVERVVNLSAPRLRYAVGPMTEKLAIVAKKVLPSRLFEWIMMKYYNL